MTLSLTWRMRSMCACNCSLGTLPAVNANEKGEDRALCNVSRSLVTLTSLPWIRTAGRQGWDAQCAACEDGAASERQESGRQCVLAMWSGTKPSAKGRTWWVRPVTGYKCTTVPAVSVSIESTRTCVMDGFPFSRSTIWYGLQAIRLSSARWSQLRKERSTGALTHLFSKSGRIGTSTVNTELPLSTSPSNFAMYAFRGSEATHQQRDERDERRVM